MLGNHLRRELVRLDWRADDFTVTFRHDIPFDDKSGWTYYGKTIGLPLLTPMPAGEDGKVLGIGLYGDFVEMYQDSFGMGIRLSYAGRSTFGRE